MSDSVDHERTNLPRLLAAEPSDVDDLKTELAARNARRANPGIELTILAARSGASRCQAGSHRL